MNEGPQPLIAIALRDGRTLQVGADGVRIGETLYELGRIQDARQVSPDPVTVALRVAGAGIVEFQPAQAADGPLALEALYRLRPHLRPAGAAPPNWPAAPPPAAPWIAPGVPYGAPGAYTPPGYPGYPAPMPPYPGGYGPPPGFGPGPGYVPGGAGGRLTPFPRDIGGVIGATFELFFAHWRRWIALGLCVAFLPAALTGALQVGVYLALGLNPWGSAFFVVTPDPQNPGAFPFHLPSWDQLLLYGGVALWQTAALAIGARDAILGREVSISRSLSDGLRRLLPVLGTNLLYGAIIVAALSPALITFGAASALLFSALGQVGPSSSGPASSAAEQALATALLLLLLGFVLYLLCMALAVFLTTRLGLAPYIAATERLGGPSALAKSWRLTRGNFWRTFVPLLVIGLVVGFVAFAGSMVEYVSLAAALLVVIPLLTACLAPLSVLAAASVLYDLRLRREGYHAIVQGEQPRGPAAP
jgi:hypothetical protein